MCVSNTSRGFLARSVSPQLVGGPALLQRMRASSRRRIYDDMTIVVLLLAAPIGETKPTDDD